MGEKNLWSKLGLIVLIVGMCAWQVYPPAERLKPGIDLGGGTSLLFEIDDSGMAREDKVNLAERVMTILKQRVDPQGTRNLVWRPIGRNRLEIQMPRPPEGQKQHRDEYEKARNAMVATNITETQIRNALSLPPEQRDSEMNRLTGAVTSRKGLFDKLLATDERYKRLNEEYDKLRPAGSQPATAPTTPPTTQSADTQLAGQIDQAFIERNQIIENLLKTNLDIRVLGDLLELGKKSRIRAEEIRKLKEAHPDLVGVMDEIIEKYDIWANKKGALDDPSDLMRLLRGAGVLEFRILATTNPANPSMIDSSNPQYNEPVGKYVDQLAKYGPRPRPGDFFQWFELAKQDDEGFGGFIVQEYTGTKYVLAHSTPDMGLLNDRSWALKSARPGRDQMGRLSVSFSLDGRGGTEFGELTGNNIKRPLCIFLDGEAISAATIQTQIFSDGQITGSFTPEYVNYLVNTLEAGALPARLKEVPLQEKSIGPALGETNRERGQTAIKVAFIATIIFMALYYAYNGLVADIAVLMNLVITLGIMSFLQATFTLPGIAGLILTLGMAVDANVLIYERIREELQRGISVRMAVKLGYEKAFSAILDSNVTTIITAVILGSLGSEEIKGFGLTLGIGLSTSMFTALFVTRQFFHVMVPTTLNAEETKRVWLGTLVLALAGGAVFGLGWLFNTPEQRPESTLIGLSKFIGVMFATAFALIICLWAFRIAYKTLGYQKSNRMPMMHLLSKPNINWMKKYRLFWGISALVIIAGIIFESGVEKSDYLDIEFIGGTSVQVEIKKELKEKFAENGDAKLLAKITGKDLNDRSHSVGWLLHAADLLAKAKVTPSGEARYQISISEKLTTAQMQALLLPKLEDVIDRGGISTAPDGVYVQLNRDKAKKEVKDQAAIERLIAQAAEYARSAAYKLRSTRVQLVEEQDATGQVHQAFELITTETSRTLVAEALLATTRDILEITQPIEATLVTDTDRAPQGIFPVKQGDNVLSEVIGGTSAESVANFKGGLVMVFDQLEPPQTAEEIQRRLREMRLQPDFESISWRNFEVVGLEQATDQTDTGDARLYKRIAIMVNDPSLPYIEDEDNETWFSEVANKELALAQAALASTRSLQRVTQFAPQVAKEATQKAIIAIILSMMAIAGYLWMRFGSVEFGIAGIIALYHDVAVTLSCVMACHLFYDTPIGKMLMLEDFKIDLTMIAAFLTIVGFSINDTIVIFDRIRENRGRLATVSATLINNSINQTLSRTLITSFTVFITVIVMYVAGGRGIHGFAFAMIIGTLSGVYSTIAIATPMIHHPRAMWIVTILAAALTAAGVVGMIDVDQRFIWIKWMLYGLVAALALIGLIKQIKAISAESPRRPAMA